MQIENTADLRRMLIQTIEGVKDGSIDPKKAQAIATLSTKILHSAKLDLDMAKFNLSASKDDVRPSPVLNLITGSKIETKPPPKKKSA